MTMLLARGVKIETIDELLAAGLAIKKSELVGRGRPGRDHANCDHGCWTASARTRHGLVVIVPDRAGRGVARSADGMGGYHLIPSIPVRSKRP